MAWLKEDENAGAGDRTRGARVTGGNTYHYTTTTWAQNLFDCSFTSLLMQTYQLSSLVDSQWVTSKLDGAGCMDMIAEVFFRTP